MAEVQKEDVKARREGPSYYCTICHVFVPTAVLYSDGKENFYHNYGAHKVIRIKENEPMPTFEDLLIKYPTEGQ